MTMTIEDAKKILKIDEQKERIEAVFETASFYVFQTIPISAKDSFDLPLKPPVCVDKRTGKKGFFNPVAVDPKELQTLKKVL